jgi:hypothetical protein
MKSSFNLAATALAAFVICSPNGAQAASLQAFAGVVGGAGTGSIPNGCTTAGPPAELAFFSGFAAGLQVLGGNAACGYSGGWTNPTSTGTTAPLTNSASLAPTLLGNPGYAESWAGTATSRASYGSLGATAHGQYSGSPASYSPTTIAASVGAATFSDTLTATVSHTYTDQSSSGFVSYRFSVDGGMTTPAAQAAYLGGEVLTDFRIQHDGGPLYDEVIVHAYAGNTGTAYVAGNATAPGWTLGTGTASGGSTFETGLFSIDLLKSWDFTAGLIVNAYGNADADFYNTAKIVGISLYDYQGNPISDFSLTSASGTNYIGAVPEPSAMPLMLAGLLGIAGWRGRRTCQSRQATNV